MEKALLAIAIGDRIDLWFMGWPGATVLKLPPRPIPDDGTYVATVHQLLTELFAELLDRHPSSDAGDLFNSIAVAVVSVPGVVDRNHVLRQLPAWDFSGSSTVQWPPGSKPPTGFDFPEELATIAAGLVAARSHQPWRSSEKQRFKDALFVVNDGSACAAFEHRLRPQRDHDFVYVKLHYGVNCGVIHRDDNHIFTIKRLHAEVGHATPELHRLDYEAGFFGVCPDHKRGCYLGMMCAHSLYRRAVEAKEAGPFSAWRPLVERLEAQGLRGRKRDGALQQHLLGDAASPTGDGHGAAIPLVAHYAALLVQHIVLGPLSPGQIVIGGRMAKPAVLAAIRENIMRWAKGYPMWDELTPKGITKFIVPSKAHHPDQQQHEKHAIEVDGALTIAEAVSDQKRLGRVIALRAHHNKE